MRMLNTSSLFIIIRRCFKLMSALQAAPFASLLAFAVLLSTSCNQTQPDATSKLSTAEQHCYVATFQQDTALMNLNFNGTKINGKMRINYGDGKVYDGTILGEHKGKGDTLILAYDFKINNVDKWYRNPVAFLKRGDRLVLGIGQINVVWGTGAFDKTVPIDYEHARFIFVPTDCKATTLK